MDYKIAFVGTKETVGGFALVGADIVPVDNSDDALSELLRLKKETVSEGGVDRQVYAIVFITEDLTSAITPDDEKKLSRGPLPAIIPIPTHNGSSEYGDLRLKRIV